MHFVTVVEREGLGSAIRLTCHMCGKSLDLPPNHLRDVMRKMRRFRDRHARCPQ